MTIFRTTIRQAIAIFFALLFLLVGVAGIKQGIRAHATERDTSTWPRVWGTLLDAKPDGLNVAVRYRYRISGVQYVGTVHSVQTFGNPLGVQNEVNRLVDDQRAQGQIAVYYDPADPSTSFLKVDAGYGVATLLASAVAIVMSGALLFHAWRGCPERAKKSLRLN